MKVLIVGSMRHLPETETAKRTEFKEACCEIGAGFANAGFTFVVGSDDMDGADRYFLEGAVRTGKRIRIEVVRPDKDERASPYFDDLQKKAKVQLIRRSIPAWWSATHLHVLREAQIVIIAGGGDTSRSVGQCAPVLGKPALVLRRLGGAGEALWDDVRRSLDAAGLPPADIEHLKETMPNLSGERVAEIVRAIVAHNPLQTKKLGPALWLLAGVIALIALWLVCLTHPNWLAPKVAFHGMLLISAVLGTCLRMVLRLVGDPTLEFDPRLLVHEGIAGLLVAFGFALFYQMSGILFTAKPVELTDADAFTRISLCMSLLGFGAAFLLNEATTALQERFLKVIKGKKEGP